VNLHEPVNFCEPPLSGTGISPSGNHAAQAVKNHWQLYIAAGFDLPSGK
jgi:hypothetical protein